MKIILASQSQRRKKLLQELGLKFECISPNVREVSSYKKPSKIVIDIAEKKAQYASKKHSKGIIIASDTLVYQKGAIIGKPTSHKHAIQILQNLTNFPHYVYTGVAIIDKYKNKTYTTYDKTKVIMHKVSIDKIKSLVKNHMDKAGAYGIQEKGDKLVKKIDGDYFNVVGLPVRKLAIILKICGKNIDRKEAEIYKNITL
ncbi:Maf family protein [bacterium]